MYVEKKLIFEKTIRINGANRRQMPKSTKAKSTSIYVSTWACACGYSIQSKDKKGNDMKVRLHEKKCKANMEDPGFFEKWGEEHIAKARKYALNHKATYTKCDGI